VVQPVHGPADQRSSGPRTSPPLHPCQAQAALREYKRKLAEIARQAARKREREEREKQKEEEAKKRQTRSKTQEKEADKAVEDEDMMSENDPDAEEDEDQVDDLAPAVDSKEYLEIHLMTKTHPITKKIHGVKKGSGNGFFGKGEEDEAALYERIWNEHQGNWMAYFKMKAQH